MKTHIYIFLLLASCFWLQGQPRYGEQAPQKKRYTQTEVLDSLSGICIYDRLINALGGDSMRYNSSGYNVQGWTEDYYTSGKLLHRGYYSEGKLVTFKNFYESGQCERVVISQDPFRCTVELFFENGSLRKKISYYNRLPQKLYAFYENGLPKYAEESDREMKYLILRKSWFISGNLESSLELTDKRNKKYEQKNYHTNGQLREEGPVVLFSGTHDYVKDGSWHLFDNNGKKLPIEKYNQGIRLNSN